jgi:hypothetical protein
MEGETHLGMPETACTTEVLVLSENLLGEVDREVRRR